ncbi:TlpA disulfide reductase family protein [Flavobacterium sp. MC2016-06]|uniref:TlpA disulfide reductase family protein n=1 Tax=Flavobacterium sp. MC2016-06 TaxID=2676308 RepID=UPI0012BA6778|nr:TlpA disulfide reductase family protein [Flavobacterium sp. MC2016-06]MBU3861436.1 AhpC/TSA family protein [Flavobacterium sp. MC2016-06]
MKNIKSIFSKAGIVLAACLSITAVNAQKAFTVKGNLGKDKQGKIRIHYKDGDQYITDSTQVKDGVFILKGKIGDPAFATIALNPTNPNAWHTSMESKKDDQVNFYLEEGTTTIQGSEGFTTAVVTGGKAQKDYAQLMNLYDPINKENKKIFELGQKYRKEQNDTAIARVRGLDKVVRQKKKDIDSTFIAKNPDSYIAFITSFKFELKGKPLDFKKDSERFNHFTKEVHSSNAGKQIAARLITAKKIDLGMTAPDFTLNDTIGKPIKLASLRGKYVLVWFWHSGIMGIESQYFNINKAYKKIDPAKFVVLGVSYERNSEMKEGNNQESELKEAWKKVIRDNNINGLNVSDFGGIDMKKNEAVSTTAKAYDLTYNNIPQCVLIDPAGKIVLKAFINNDLLPKLKKIIGE